MAPFVPVENTVQVNLNMRLRGQKCQNSLWFRKGSGVTQSDMISLASAAEAWWRDEYAAYVTSAVTLNNIHLRDYTSQNGLVYTIFPTGAAGAGSGTPANNNVAINMVFYTGFAGRSYRGANRVLGFDRDSVDTDAVESTLANDFISAYSVLTLAPLVPGFSWVVASRFTKVGPRSSGITSVIVQVGIPTLYIASQKTRIEGRGD